MSKYLGEYLKQALWEAHGRKCFYCREPIAYKNIHIDHVIPQKAFKIDSSGLIAKYKLNSSFDFNSLENFAPSCQACNTSRKRHKELEAGIPIWLEELSSKIPEIKKNAARLEYELSLDLPNEYQDFFVSSPDFLLSKLSFEKIRKKDIPLYKQLSFNPAYFPLSLVYPGDDKNKVRINNLQDYEDCSKKGYYALTTPEIALASKCQACLDVFEIFEKAVSIVNRVKLSEYYKKLPIRILSPCSTEEAEYMYSNCETISNYLDWSGITRKKNSDSSISIYVGEIQPNGRQVGYRIDEILQADFTGDGNTEVLLFIYYQSGGTLQYVYSCHCIFLDDKWVFKKK